MTVVIGAVIGFLTGRMLWLALRRTWQQDTLLRKNYQGNLVPTAAGVILILTVVLLEGLRSLLSGGSEAFTASRLAVVVVIAGFAILGLLDDLLGDRGPKGFAGHLRAMASGQLTSGGMKMVGGAAVALLGAAIIGSDGVLDLLLGAGVIALAANLFNLFDLRPGRATKIGGLTFLVVALVAALDPALLPVAIVVGAAIALLNDELHERLMLGDTGANALGAAIGMALVIAFGTTGTAIAFAVLVGLNLLSEVVSFSKIIDKTPPLAALDRLGRPKASTVDVRDTAIRMPAEPFAKSTAASRGATVEAAHVGAASGSPFGSERSSLQSSGQRTSNGDHFDRRPFEEDLFGDDADLRTTNDDARHRRNPVEDDRPEWPF